MTSFPFSGASAAADTRELDKDALSLALMDARNHTLSLLGAHEECAGRSDVPSDAADTPYPPPVWMAGQLAWLAEWWINRNPQRTLGVRSPGDGIRLASLLPQADTWFHPRGDRWHQPLPDAAEVRSYMLDQLEGTLELLDKAVDSAQGLDLYRAVLLHEDARSEHFLVQAQSLGLDWRAAVQRPPARAARAPVVVPATRWTPGSPPGFSASPEDPQAQALDVPTFEIDAQAVSWAQYLEFVDDGGYDRPELWHPTGWQWVQASGRRAPAHVEQITLSAGAAAQNFFGKLARLAGQQPVMHVSWWEADAWTRWAGRRLPAAVEWEAAAHAAARQGFHWGDVHEWTAATLRPSPGLQPQDWTEGTFLDPRPAWGAARVRCGASFLTPPRLRQRRSRSFALPDSDQDFVGFRSCAI